MAHMVETMAFANELPWHGLGNKVSNDLTPEQMLKASALDWTVSKRKMFFTGKDGALIEDPEKFKLVRDTDDQPLTTVGATYKPVQNEVAADFFTKFCKAGHMDMETAGSLWNGRYIWCLARVKQDFKIGKVDEVRPYLLLMQPHVIGHAMTIQFTPIRVVCWNTLNFALGKGLKGDSSAFRMGHATVFDDSVKARAEEALGLAKIMSGEFKEAVQLLSKAKATPEQTEEFFCEVLQWDPKAAAKSAKKLKKGEKEKEVREPSALPKFRLALTHAPGQAINTAAGTWWGALNAVTYVMDHDKGRDPSTALKNAWIGHKAGIKARAFDLALKKAA